LVAEFVEGGLELLEGGRQLSGWVVVAAEGGLGVGHDLLELAHAPRGGTFGGVGHAALGVVVDGGVGVERVEGEVLPGVAEVVLLAPPVEHACGDLGGGQVVP
jgi:hypothetical protein